MKVEVVSALPAKPRCASLTLPVGARVRDAIAAAGFPHHDLFGIFGRRVGPDYPLTDGDRVEIYRPLAVDPKEARRRRAGKRR